MLKSSYFWHLQSPEPPWLEDAGCSPSSVFFSYFLLFCVLRTSSFLFRLLYSESNRTATYSIYTKLLSEVVFGSEGMLPDTVKLKFQSMDIGNMDWSHCFLPDLRQERCLFDCMSFKKVLFFIQWMETPGLNVWNCSKSCILTNDYPLKSWKSL